MASYSVSNIKDLYSQGALLTGNPGAEREWLNAWAAKQGGEIAQKDMAAYQIDTQAELERERLGEMESQFDDTLLLKRDTFGLDVRKQDFMEANYGKMSEYESGKLNLERQSQANTSSYYRGQLQLGQDKLDSGFDMDDMGELARLMAPASTGINLDEQSRIVQDRAAKEVADAHDAYFKASEALYPDRSGNVGAGNTGGSYSWSNESGTRSGSSNPELDWLNKQAYNWDQF